MSLSPSASSQYPGDSYHFKEKEVRSVQPRCEYAQEKHKSHSDANENQECHRQDHARFQHPQEDVEQHYQLENQNEHEVDPANLTRKQYKQAQQYPFPFCFPPPVP
eukprot:scpid114353/ scgid27234/ 